MFHFDVPWNPSRMEQRNGRIDRKLQPAPVVYCRYFYYAQRKEDRVLQVLVRKTKTIKEELGSLSAVLDNDLAKIMRVYRSKSTNKSRDRARGARPELNRPRTKNWRSPRAPDRTQEPDRELRNRLNESDARSVSKRSISATRSRAR
jgi:hypothetical protein